MRTQHRLLAVVAGVLLLSGGGNLLAQPLPTPADSYDPAPQTETAASAKFQPFETASETTYVEDGLWYQDSGSQFRQDYFTVEALFSKMRRPGVSKLVGSPGVPVFDPVGGIFPAVTLDAAIQDDLDSHGGVRLRWGHTNPDKSGFEVEGYWIADGDKKRQAGIPGNEAMIQTLSTNFGLPLVSGVRPDGTLNGVTQPYDKEFRLIAKAETYGASASVLRAPILGGGQFTVRPLYGVKYIYIREDFFFFGSDSSFAVLFPSDRFGEFAQSATPLGLPPVNAYLNSRVRSHLVGPEIGLQYDLGGDKIKLWGRTKVSLLANHQRLRIRGDDIGDGFSGGRLDGVDNTFLSRQSHTNVSPALETSIFLRAKVFGMIPLLRNIAILKDAVFQTGYTYQIVGEVTRPAESIVWQGAPLVPNLKTSRSKWTMSNWSLGVSWVY